MRRPFAVRAEVARRVDDAGAEMALPDAIDDDARGERMRRRSSSASSSRPLPFVNGAGSRSLRTLRKRRGTSSPSLHRVAADADLQVRRLLDVPHAVDVRVLRRQRLLAASLMSARSASTCARRSPLKLPLEAPAAKRSTPGLMYSHARRLEAFREVALEDVGPELHLLGRQALQLEAAAGTEVVVGDELVRAGWRASSSSCPAAPWRG